MKNKKTLVIVAAVVVVLAVVLGIVFLGGNETPAPVTEKEYKLGMGVVVSTASSKTGNAQVDATVATVVLDDAGKIVACRIDVAQNKMVVTDGEVELNKTFETKMELGTRYGMGGSAYAPDNNGDGKVLEWDVQTKEFEKYVVGKTAAQVAAMTTKTVNNHEISTDDALLNAGCTIQITDFRDAVVKACKDAQGVSFKTAGTVKLGVAAITTVDEATKAATEEADGTVAMYTDFAASAVVDGKIVASLNDAIQPKITINTAGEIVGSAFKGTKRELKGEYGMAAAVNYGMDWNGDGVVKEWFEQSLAFSKHVVGMTAAQVKAMGTQEVPGQHYIISNDEALLSAGCTIQITGIKAVVAQSVTNAR